jgi:hypothetical protein
VAAGAANKDQQLEIRRTKLCSSRITTIITISFDIISQATAQQPGSLMPLSDLKHAGHTNVLTACDASSLNQHSPPVRRSAALSTALTTALSACCSVPTAEPCAPAPQVWVDTSRKDILLGTASVGLEQVYQDGVLKSFYPIYSEQGRCHGRVQLKTWFTPSVRSACSVLYTPPKVGQQALWRLPKLSCHPHAAHGMWPAACRPCRADVMLSLRY